MRIGELSRRSGVSPQLLRTWEQRYGLLSPARTPGGFRVYSTEDERRVAAMQRHLGEGFSASAAARLVLGSGEPAPAGGEGTLAEMGERLYEAAREFDEREANVLLDRAFDRYTLTTVIEDLVMPFLLRLGRGWAEGDVTVAQEHFATALVRARLMTLARNWSSGSGRLALLACAPGEHHDLVLICFGLALRERGWSITLLGGDTPVETLDGAAAAVSPEVVVVTAVDPAALETSATALAELAGRHRVILAGPGATDQVAERVGAMALRSSPTAAAVIVDEDASARTGRTRAGGT